MKKLVRNPILVFFSLFQPIIFLLLFTQLFSNLGRFIGSGTLSYTTFATAGIVLQNAFSSAFQSGTAVVDDIKSGFLAKMLATPVNRSAILFGRLLSDVFRVVAQAVIILVLAYALGVYPATGPVGYLLVIFTVAFFGLAWSGISSPRTEDQERGDCLRHRRSSDLPTLVHEHSTGLSRFHAKLDAKCVKFQSHQFCRKRDTKPNHWMQSRFESVQYRI